MKGKSLILMITTVLLISCMTKNKDNKPKIEKDFKNNNYSEIEYLPDTAIVNRTYEGKIKYSSDLDTIELSKNDNRFIILYMTTQKGIFDNVESIEKVKHGAFAIDENNLIPYRFEFEQKGNNNLKGIIQDMVILDNYYSDGKARIITLLTNIEKEIYVK